MKNNKGITLIALIITIIVMLILAAVAIRLATGDSGVIGKAGQATKYYSEKEFEEILNNEIAGAKIDLLAYGNSLTDEQIKTIIQNLMAKVPGIEYSGSGNSFSYNGISYTINEKGEIIKKEDYKDSYTTEEMKQLLQRELSEELAQAKSEGRKMNFSIVNHILDDLEENINGFRYSYDSSYNTDYFYAKYNGVKFTISMETGEITTEIMEIETPDPNYYNISISEAISQIELENYNDYQGALISADGDTALLLELEEDRIKFWTYNIAEDEEGDDYKYQDGKWYVRPDNEWTEVSESTVNNVISGQWKFLTLEEMMELSGGSISDSDRYIPRSVMNMIFENAGGTTVIEEDTDSYTFYGSISSMINSSEYLSSGTSSKAKKLSNYANETPHTLYLESFNDSLINDVSNIYSISDLTTYSQTYGEFKSWRNIDNGMFVIAINENKTKAKIWGKTENKNGQDIVKVEDCNLSYVSGEQYRITLSGQSVPIFIPSGGNEIYFLGFGH